MGKRFSLLAAACTFALFACDVHDPATPTLSPDGALGSTAAAEAHYVVLADQPLSGDLEARLAAAGGRLVTSIPQIGVAVIASSSPDFPTSARRIAGVAGVGLDVVVQWQPPVGEVVEVEHAGLPPFTGSADRFLDLQWAVTAMRTQEAWALGHRGAGVRVGILDSGIRSTHADLAPNLNTSLSVSFVPGEAYDNPAGFHGTHVSGIVAAAENGIGTIGVAPEAEIVSIKVLSGVTGSGAFSWIMQGLVYAADNGVDVVNMSLGATVPRRGFAADPGFVGTQDVAALITAVGRATRYAHENGVTLIASAGNDGLNSNRRQDLFHFMSDLPHVLSVSATGPMGWALDHHTELDRLASYSNYGFSTIDFAAPGGDFALPGNALCTIVAGGVQSVTVPCWVFDMVMSTSNAGDFNYAWTAGTSMAAPQATGVAALIIGKNGGAMRPAAVAAALQQAAENVGKPGKDAAFGHGRLSALLAVQ